MGKLVADAWAYVFDHRVSPLRHLPNVGTRHLILQILGGMWAIAFAVAIGSYTLLPVSLLGHAALIAAAVVTAATYTTAATKPQLLSRVLGRRHDGEHE